MSNAYQNETAYTTLLNVITAMPGIPMMGRNERVEEMLAQKNFDLTTYRMNLDLSDTALEGTHTQVEKGTHNWWIDEFRMGDSLGITLDLELYLEDGRKITRVLGVDCETKRILAPTGRVYQMGRRLVSPIEVAVSIKPAPHALISAEYFLYGEEAEEMAKRYVANREDDAMKFFKELKWDTSSKGFRYCVEANIYGVKIVHEMQPCALHAGAVWGELFFPNQPEREPIIFHTFDQFIAYMLAKYW